MTGALLWGLTACAPKPSQEFVKSVQDEYQSVESSLNQRLSEVETQVASLQDPFGKLKSELGKVWTDKVEKDKDLASRIQAVNEKSQQLLTEFNTAKSDISTALTEAKSFVDGVPTQQKRDDDLKPEWEKYKNTLNEKRQSLEKVAESLTALNSEISTLTDEIKKKYAPKK